MVVQRIDLSQIFVNAYIINLIDVIKAKIENPTILEWLQSILVVIFIIASKDANLYQATIWIPNHYFPDSVQFISKEILGGHKPQGWKFTIYLYNAVDLVECIKAWSYAVDLFS